jgi:hypothetical protein
MSVWLRKIRSCRHWQTHLPAWQTHLPDATAGLRKTRSLARHWQTHLPAWQTHLPDATAGLRKTRSLARHWQTHLPDAISLHPGAVLVRGTGGSYVEKPAETLRLALAS